MAASNKSASHSSFRRDHGAENADLAAYLSALGYLSSMQPAPTFSSPPG